MIRYKKQYFPLFMMSPQEIGSVTINGTAPSTKNKQTSKIFLGCQVSFLSQVLDLQ